MPAKNKFDLIDQVDNYRFEPLSRVSSINFSTEFEDPVNKDLEIWNKENWKKLYNTKVSSSPAWLFFLQRYKKFYMEGCGCTEAIANEFVRDTVLSHANPNALNRENDVYNVFGKQLFFTSKSEPNQHLLAFMFIEIFELKSKSDADKYHDKIILLSHIFNTEIKVGVAKQAYDCVRRHYKEYNFVLELDPTDSKHYSLLQWLYISRWNYLPVQSLNPNMKLYKFMKDILVIGQDNNPTKTIYGPIEDWFVSLPENAAGNEAEEFKLTNSLLKQVYSLVHVEKEISNSEGKKRKEREINPEKASAVIKWFEECLELEAPTIAALSTS